MNDRIKLIRKALGMTQEQLAQHLGIGKAALSMIETGRAGVSARNRNILVQELNVNPEWLDGGKGQMFNAEPDLTAYRHRTDNSLPLQSVPLYSIEGTAGLVPLFTDSARMKPLNYIHIPNLPTVKYIQKAERDDYVKLVSQNPHHADKEIAKSRIRALALVKASIRMNSIR